MELGTVRATKIWLAAALGLSGLLTACSSAPAPYTRQGGTTIGLPTPYLPDSVALTSDGYVSTVAKVGGAISPLGADFYDEMVQYKQQTKFDAQLTQLGFDPGPFLIKDLTAQLQAEGYTLVPEDVDRIEDDFLDSYPDASPALPQLDVVLHQVGYHSNGTNLPYQPMVELDYRLVGTDGQTLTQGSFHYSGLHGEIHSSPAYDFQDYAALSAIPNVAAEGLETGLHQAALTIAKGLN